MKCTYCQRSIVDDGRSIHYCIERKKVGKKTISVRREYVAHFDGTEIGYGFGCYLYAEQALDAYVYDLCEQGLIDTLPQAA